MRKEEEGRREWTEEMDQSVARKEGIEREVEPCVSDSMERKREDGRAAKPHPVPTSDVPSRVSSRVSGASQGQLPKPKAR